MENKTKFAIGCLVQWYEINIIKEYISSIKSAVNNYNKNDVIIVFDLVANQALEKFDGSEDEFQELINDLVNEVEFIKKDGFNVVYKTHRELYSIADSRRDFNDNYCEQVDTLI